MISKKPLNSFELVYNTNKKIPIDFLNDEIDVDFCFFHIFWTFMLSKIELSDQVKVSLRKFALSKSLLLNHILNIEAITYR